MEDTMEQCEECGKITGKDTWWIKVVGGGGMRLHRYCSPEHANTHIARIYPTGRVVGEIMDMAIEHDNGTLADIFKKRELDKI